ncbi:uncharacterized protein ISCGN_013041 [Ixodes scapularis]
MSSTRYATRRCSVEECRSDNRTAGVSLHRFPVDTRRREAWVRFSNNRGLQGKTPWQLRNMVVCSLHFKASAFLRPGYLRHNAVPTVLAPEETTRGEVSSESCTVSAVANERSSPAPPTYRYPGRSDSQSSCGIPDDQSSEMELSLEEGRSSLSSSSCTSSSRPDSRSSCGIPDVRSSEIELSLEEGRSSPSSSSCTSSSRPDSRSSCGIPDVRSSEIELSLEEGRSSPTSSTCTYSSRPDSQSSCGIPDDQSSEIGLSLEEEGCSSASWDHTYSCLPLENSPLEAHADHSYALPQNAVPAHESSGDMADMAPSIYGPSPEDSLSSSAGVLSHRASSKARSTDKRKMDALRAKVRQVREQNKRLQRRLQRQRQMRTVAEVVESVRIRFSSCRCTR